MECRRGRGAVAIREERELQLAREAIVMVASGASPRVVIAGIRFADQILDAARRLATESGVSANVVRRGNRPTADLVIEPASE
jgi:hypothetical protein